MFLKIDNRCGKLYGALVHNFRSKGKIKQKRLLSFGELTQIEIASIRNWLAGFPKTNPHAITTTIENLEIVSPVTHGREFIVRSVWKRLETDNVLKKCGLTSKEIDLVSVIVINRCVAPSSKYHILEWYPTTSLRYLHKNLPPLPNENQFYRAMDSLNKNKNYLEKIMWQNVKEKFNLKADALFYDITSTYFEGSKCEIAKKGYSRDKRPDCLQINIGIVLNDDLFPIMHEVFDGNTVDKTTVNEVCKRLYEEIKVTDCSFIGDRGIITMDNIEIIRNYGYHYILCEINRNVVDVVTPELKKLKFERVDDALSIAEIPLNDERLIICKNEQKIMDDKIQRDDRIKKGIQLINEIKDEVKSGRLVMRDKVLKKLVKKLSQKKLDHYFDLEHLPFEKRIKDFDCSLIEEIVKKEEAMDGIWVLRTDMNERKPSEIVKIFKRLNRVEDTFKEIKSVLDLRPIYHRLEDRVKAHVVLCILGYTVNNSIEYLAKRNGLEMTAEKFINKFGNVVRGDVVVGTTEIMRVPRISKLTEEQEKLLRTIDIAPDSMRQV